MIAALRNRVRSAQILGPSLKIGVPTMSDESEDTLDQQLLKIDGALDVLFELREEFALWAEEAEDASKEEALENVLNHVEAVETEYKRRRDDLQARIQGS